MTKELNFTITYGKRTYTFQQGSKVYIFHIGIYNDMDKKYSMKSLLEYISFVHDCYIIDDNPTPLGALADYIAKHWKKLKNKGHRAVLEEFYNMEI